jgi:acyl carrier protein
MSVLPEESGKDIRHVIRLVDQVKLNPSHQTNLDTRLLEDAALDSLALMDLAEEVQREMQVTFRPEDYSFENLGSVRSILRLITRKRGLESNPGA